MWEGQEITPPTLKLVLRWKNSHFEAFETCSPSTKSDVNFLRVYTLSQRGNRRGTLQKKKFRGKSVKKNFLIFYIIFRCSKSSWKCFLKLKKVKTREARHEKLLSAKAKFIFYLVFLSRRFRRHFTPPSSSSSCSHSRGVAVGCRRRGPFFVFLLIQFLEGEKNYFFLFCRITFNSSKGWMNDDDILNASTSSRF